MPGRGLHPFNPTLSGLANLTYRFGDRDILVTACGRICLHRRKINFSTVFAGQTVGIKKSAKVMWLVSFMQCDLGYFDLEQKNLQSLDSPFGPRQLRAIIQHYSRVMVQRN